MPLFLTKKNFHSFKLIYIMATVIIPTPLRKFTNQTAKLQVDGHTIAEVIGKITLDFPELKKHLLDSQGAVRSFVNIFSGDDDIRDLENEKTLVDKATIISIVPAIAGGIA
jgi:sulfur-carrier protein